MQLLENIAREFPLLGDMAAHLLNLEYPSRRVQGESSESWVLGELDHIIETGDEAEAIQAEIDKLNFQKGVILSQIGGDNREALETIEYEIKDLTAQLQALENPSEEPNENDAEK
jgi:seryl-tRNA synthetase